MITWDATSKLRLRTNCADGVVTTEQRASRLDSKS